MHLISKVFGISYLLYISVNKPKREGTELHIIFLTASMLPV